MKDESNGIKHGPLTAEDVALLNRSSFLSDIRGWLKRERDEVDMAAAGLATPLPVDNQKLLQPSVIVCYPAYADAARRLIESYEQAEPGNS